MKIRTIVTSLVLAIIGLTAFAFVNSPKTIYISTKKAICHPSNVGNKLFEEEASQALPDLMYVVKGRDGRPVAEAKLKQANSLSDIIEYYPSNWIEDYTSVEILSTFDNKESKAVGPNDDLTKTQKELFKSIAPGSELLITVNYNTKNPVTNENEKRQMNVALTVTPLIEAEYVGGYDEMISYLHENSLDKISEKNLEELQLSTILFTVNKNGQVDNVRMNNTSGYNDVDDILVKLISDMPKWNAAKNSEGLNVSQEFQFNFGLSRAMEGC